MAARRDGQNTWRHCREGRCVNVMLLFVAILATIGRLDVVDDIRSADWLGLRMHSSPPDVCSIVPAGFPAYARIFHPSFKWNISTGRIDRVLSWAETAEETGKIAHALMQWETIRPRVTSGDEPAIGILPSRLAELLVSALAVHTGTPDSCWYGAWNGKFPSLIQVSAPVFRIPLRDMYLLHGPLSGLPQNLAPSPVEARANIAWPSDRSWVLATDIDLRTTYLAGSMDCVRSLVESSSIEAFSVQSTDLVTLGSDTLNDKDA